MSVYHPELKAGRFIPRFKSRAGMTAFMQRVRMKPPATPDDMIIEDVTVPGLDGNPPTSLRIYRPKSLATVAPALFWIHGGGYIQGSPVQDEKRSIETARRLGITVAAVTYRLAPGSAFPAAHDDAFAGLSWLFANAESRGIDRARIAVGGASAGGGLAACLVLRAHDEGMPVKFQLLVYPMLDDRTALRTDLDADRSARLWIQQNNLFGWSAYLGETPGGLEVSPYAAAARRGDVSGLPPAWIGVGTLDLFHDEDLVYAARLTEAGVPCDVFIVPGAFHGFDVVFGKTAIGQQFFDAQLAALRAALR